MVSARLGSEWGGSCDCSFLEGGVGSSRVSGACRCTSMTASSAGSVMSSYVGSSIQLCPYPSMPVTVSEVPVSVFRPPVYSRG